MPTQILICGLVRNVEQLKDKVLRFAGFRQEGLIEKIVYSTWIGELDRYPGLEEFLEQQKVIVVMSKEPSLVMPAHPLQQMQTYYYGLQFFDDEDLILKTRTDLAGFDPNMLSYFSKEISIEREETSIFDVFSGRVIVEYAQILYPFIIGDAQFFGKKKDLDLLFNMDLFYDLIFQPLSTEQKFFSKPFVKKFPIIGNHFFANRPYIQESNNQYQEQMDYLLQSDYFLEVLATYHYLLKANFIVGWVPKEHYNLAFRSQLYNHDELIVFEEIFNRSSQIYGAYVGHDGTVTFKSKLLIDLLTEGSIKETEIGISYLRAQRRVNDSHFQSSFKFSPANLSSEASSFYTGFANKFQVPGISDYKNPKLFNQSGIPSEKNYIKGSHNVFAVNKENNLIKSYMEQINLLIRENYALAQKLRHHRFGVEDTEKSLPMIHRIIRFCMPNALLKIIKQHFPIFITWYKKVIRI